MKVNVHTVYAFSKNEEGGNPAGVVLNAESLNETDMQTIAHKVGYSETAFLLTTDQADFQIRYFTPSEEVDLCGHATVASFYLLFQQGKVQVGEYTIKTKAGLLKVEVEGDGQIFLEQAYPQHYGEIPQEEIAESLNISRDALIKDLPIEIVSTGLKDIIVPVNTLKDLLDIQPDFEKIIAISERYEAVGYHVFTLETLHDSTAHCRNFAPLFHIPEESATGTASGALSSYLFKHGKVKEPYQLQFEQGYSMGKPSEINVQLQCSNKKIKYVKVGGKAVLHEEIEILL